MNPIPFTQYLRPDGRRRAMSIVRSPEITALAAQIMAAGYVFEMEVLGGSNDNVYLECRRNGRMLSNRLVRNGPLVPEAVDQLVREAYKNLPSKK